jgi:hypothetical protein
VGQGKRIEAWVSRLSVLAALSSGTGTGAGTWRLLKVAARATLAWSSLQARRCTQLCGSAYLYSAIGAGYSAHPSVGASAATSLAALAGFSGAAAKFSGLEPCAGGEPSNCQSANRLTQHKSLVPEVPELEVRVLPTDDDDDDNRIDY